MPSDMSTAHFKTLQDLMGMRSWWIARQLNVGMKRVQRYGGHNAGCSVSPQAEEFILSWLTWFMDQVDDVLDRAEAEEKRRGGDDPLVVTLYRVPNDGMFSKMDNPRGMTWDMHCALVQAKFAALELQGFVPRVEWASGPDCPLDDLP